MNNREIGPEAEYLSLLASGQFMLQRDPQSGSTVFPPRLRAPSEGHALEPFQPVSGRGKIYSLTIQPRKPPEPARIIVLVDLEEGGRMLSHMPDVKPGTVSIGDAVKARILADGETPTIVFDVAK